MTIEQLQELAELTETAASSNDIETLIKIAKIIDDDELTTDEPNPEGAEWFYSLLTAQQIEAIEKNS
jgi:hypothetical protein